MVFLSFMMKFTAVFVVAVIPWADAGSLWFCDMDDDPCYAANISTPFEPELRAENCIYNSYQYCDRYITPGWHRFKEDMLNHPPNLLSCGAVYPSWLNGSLPTMKNEEVERKVCKVGFESVCVKDVTIRIKHCGSFNAYCLPALDACSERYCFGERDASCPVTTSPKPATTPIVQKTSTTSQPSEHTKRPTTRGPTKRPTTRGPTKRPTTRGPTRGPTTRGPTRGTTKNPFFDAFCSADPCMLNDIPNIPNTKDRSENCKYTHFMQSCDRDLFPGWYKADDNEQKLLNRCPGVLSCGAIHPVWMQGSHPSVYDGIVQREICTSGVLGGIHHNCCMERNAILVRNCGRYTAYCLKPMKLCEERYCFEKHEQCSADNEYVEKSPLPHRSHMKESAIVIAVVLITLTIIAALVVFFLQKSQHFRRYCNKTSIYEKPIQSDKPNNDYETLNVKYVIMENDYMKFPEKKTDFKLSTNAVGVYTVSKN